MDLRRARQGAGFARRPCTGGEEGGLKSPCVNVCVLDTARGVCRGCGRTLDEISRWSSMSDAERDAIMEKLAADRIDWYFDFVSPFSHICLYRLNELPHAVNFKPVLFAGLLNHWGQKGPAEIPAKRQWTYRWCTWWARELGVPFRFPKAHPFNPLHYLRLSIACGNRPEAVRRIFDFIWTTGEDASDAGRFSRLCGELGIDQASLAETKDLLRKNTEEAAQRGVFGVPSFFADGEVFWGADAIGFLKAFLADRRVVRNDEMRRVDGLPVAAARKT
jgi:2-hydroxychromene-2-carboxylate isomerase